MRIGLRDAWHFAREKAMWETLVGLLILLVVLAATHTLAWEDLFGWLALIVLATVVFIIRALRGGNSLWQRHYTPQSNSQVYLEIRYRGLVANRLSMNGPALRIRVVDPRGVRYLTNSNVWGGGGAVYSIYPQGFNYPKGSTPASALAPGIHTVTFWERPFGSTRWRLMDVGQFDGQERLAISPAQRQGQ
jgi:hypothetical protein